VRARLLAGLMLLCGLSAAAEIGKIARTSIISAGKERTYWLYLPPTAPADEKLPLVVALHGRGGKGKPILKKWKDLADAEKIALAGPDSSDSLHWEAPVDGPAFLRDVVEDVGRRHPIDGRRVYLFGYSAGAVFSFQVATLESGYFGAVAIDAGSILPRYFHLFDLASRKIPYAIFIGTRDAFFPLDHVRATRDALKERGFPVEYTEIEGHGHEYSESAKEINKAAWEFFRKNPLPSEPRYTEYR
jgi:poly(3-hydroxybutyrate) depolymerase